MGFSEEIVRFSKQTSLKGVPRLSQTEFFTLKVLWLASIVSGLGIATHFVSIVSSILMVDSAQLLVSILGTCNYFFSLSDIFSHRDSFPLTLRENTDPDPHQYFTCRGE